MKAAILEHLNGVFYRKVEREPTEVEKKRLDYLAFIYSRDLKYILKMDMKEFRYDKSIDNKEETDKEGS